MTLPTLILGLGNPLQRDDGIGSAVVQELLKCPLPENVQVLDGGTPGVGLLNLLEGRRRVLIVDAAEMDQPPGTVVRFSPDQVNLRPSELFFSLHGAGVSDALALGQALDMPLPEIIIFGVQPAHIDWGEGLSAAVEAAIPAIVKAVLSEAGAYNGERKNSDH